MDQKIEKASVIALAKYEEELDGRLKAIITEVLKKNDDAIFHYEVGSEYPQSSFYPREEISYGDGVVIFSTGSPERMQMSIPYSGDRIRALEDIPLNLFREKCRQ